MLLNFVTWKGLLFCVLSQNIPPRHISVYIKLTVSNDESVCFIKSRTHEHNNSRSGPGKDTVSHKRFSVVIITTSGLSYVCLMKKQMEELTKTLEKVWNQLSCHDY